MTTVFKYAWRHGILEMDEYDSLEDAVKSGHWAREYGEESLMCIEVINQDGTEVYDQQASYALMRPLVEADTVAYKARPPAVAMLEVRAPESDEPARGEVFSSLDEAHVVRDRLISILGPHRVRLVSLPRRLSDPKPDWP